MSENIKAALRESLHRGSASRRGNKVMVIGLDGASFNHMLPMIASLPNIRRLTQEGTWGTLLADVLPGSASGWTTIATGTQMGKHGIYLFHDPHSYEDRIVTPSDRGAPAIWNLLSEADKKVVVVNVPLTYPPEEVNGILISGLPAPPNSVFTHPPSLTPKLTNFGYVPEILEQSKKEPYIALNDLRAKLALQLCQEPEWDFFMVVFTELDRIFHHFGNDSGFVESYYKRLDALVGGLREALPEEMPLVLVSDHGMHRYDRAFHVNSWLASKGLYALKSWGILGRTKRAFVRRVLRGNVPAHIDWRATKAYAQQDRAITINLRGREQEGVVGPGDEYEETVNLVRRDLLRVRDPATGERIVDWVARREELFQGPRIQEMPDLMFDTGERYYLDFHKWLSRSLVSRLRPPYWHHDRQAMYLLKGKGIKRGLRLDTEIVNIAPTLLYLMGQSLPSYMDGTVIEEALEPAYLSHHPINVVERQLAPVGLSSSKGREMDEAVRRRLEGLGYLG